MTGLSIGDYILSVNSWNFLTSADADSFANRTNAGLTGITNTSYANYWSTGADPWVECQTITSFLGSAYDKIRMRYRVNAGTGTLYYYWWNGSSYKWSSSIGLNTDGEWHTITTDMSGDSNWTGATISRFRFDIGGAAGEDVDIDYISIGTYGAVTGATGAQGATGIQGVTGLQGYTGSGTQGATGVSVGYALILKTASQSTTTDGQTLYWGGMSVAPSTTAARWRTYIPKDGTIKAAYIYSYAGTAGTNESWPSYIRKNNSSDTLIQSLSAATNDRVWSNTSLSISVVAGDYIEIKEVCPTWATNPATVTRTGTIYIE
jgi:hypothetical protein